MLKGPEHGFGFQEGFGFPSGDRLSILHDRTLGRFPERHGFGGDLGFKRAPRESEVCELGGHSLSVARGHGALLALGAKGGGDQLAGLGAHVFGQVVFRVGGLTFVVNFRVCYYNVSVNIIQIVLLIFHISKQ